MDRYGMQQEEIMEMSKTCFKADNISNNVTKLFVIPPVISASSRQPLKSVHQKVTRLKTEAKDFLKC